MDSLDNELSENKYEEKWFDWFQPLILDIFLFTLSLLVVLQTFSVVYRMTIIISSLYIYYVKPLEVVRESDLDPFDDIYEDEEDSETKHRVVDLILE